MKMFGKAVILFVLCTVPTLAQDQLFSGSGSVDGITYNWFFDVNSTLVNSTDVQTGDLYSYDDSIISGKLDSSLGGSLTMINDTFEHLPGETMVMAGWGYQDPVTLTTEWELITGSNGAYMQYDPPPLTHSPAPAGDPIESFGAGTVVTPEPSTYVFIIAAIVVMIACKRFA